MFTYSDTCLVPAVNWTDLYKLSMGQAVWQLYPKVEARYAFINRGNIIFPPGYEEALREQVNLMSQLSVSADTLQWMRRTIPGLSEEWLCWYAGFRFDPNEVSIDSVGGGLRLMVEGPWHRAIYWETPILSLASNLYNRMTGRKPIIEWRSAARERAYALRNMRAQTIEFGTRRAYSPQVHMDCLEELIACAGRVNDGGVLLGTSNVALAEKYDLQPMGTFAHEWVMAHAAMHGYVAANAQALHLWLDQYKGAYATALTDTFTTEVFLRTFDKRLAMQFSGVRHDSGDPFTFMDLMISHYLYLGIDPRTKTIVFSDNLTVDVVREILAYSQGRIKCVFGIGTDLTNNITGLSPLNIVMKLMAIRLSSQHDWIPTVKLSDNPVKIAGDSQAVLQAYTALGIHI